MVKRSKLTLKHTEAKEHVVEEKEEDIDESLMTEQAVVSERSAKDNLGKMLIMVGLTIASLIIFRQKIF